MTVLSFVGATFILLVPSVLCKTFTLQATNSRSAGNHASLHLSEATDGTGILIQSLLPYSINFCLRKESEVKLTNLRFSNINNMTIFTIVLDGVYWFGTYRSLPDNDYNSFKDTGAFPRDYVFHSGWHVLKIIVYSGYADIALDHIVFDVADQWMTEDVFNCETICIPDGKFPIERQTLTERTSYARASQRSESTTCPEVDNVNIPLYHPSVQDFSITASMPQYNSFSNRRYEDPMGCPHLSPVLWRFANFDISPTFSRKIADDNKTSLDLFFNGNESPNLVNLMATFRLDGKSVGSIDASIGSTFFLKLKPEQMSVNVSFKYRHGNGSFSEPITRYYNATNDAHAWSVPDFTWNELEDNQIHLSFESEAVLQISVETLLLERRPMLPEQQHTLYRSNDVIIVGVFVEFWWLSPESMTVNINGMEVRGISYIQFYRPIPWNEGYAQVFVLYMDGNVRILPIAPEGLDWIPFGTSFIVGQTDTNMARPYALISQLNIDPERWTMKLLYKGGGSADMRLQTTYRETNLFVQNVRFVKDTTTHPFLTIRSMYVSEGNNDVDSIKVDDTTSYHILDNWGSLNGRSFAFFRRCISKHLTLSPDLQIDLLRTDQHVPLGR